MILLRLIKESLILSLQSLRNNVVRTILSLLGITIGILAIISVLTVVDSMEKSVKSSFSALGDDVIFIQKWPWGFGGEYPWWKYLKRPVTNLDEYQFIQRKAKTISYTTFNCSARKTAKYKSNAIENATVMMVSKDNHHIFEVNIEKGRYLSTNEFIRGVNHAVIGYTIAQNLYGNIDPIGKEIKVMGRKFKIIGVMKKEGESIFQMGPTPDEQIIIPIKYGATIINVENEMYQPFIAVKKSKNISNLEVKDEITALMRQIRRLKPKQEDNFAINESNLLSTNTESLFKSISLGGWVIGIFSILVGGFGIANIMFVSVKERTTQIGIQKSLGAKNYFILLQFLFEAIFLSLFGGAIGLLIVFLLTLAAKSSVPFDLSLSLSNIIKGIIISATIGLLSGILPAINAARMNPVEAIRANQ